MRVPLIDQRHLDLIGLGLVAIGVFLAFPIYLHWDGGAAGQAASDGLAYLVGDVKLAAPVAVVIAGALFVLRPVLPAVRPFRAGALCLFAALTLALAGGTFGIGPEGMRDGYWNEDFFRPRGGIVGDALLYAVATAVSTIGAHILAVFLFVAGVLLLTGASVAGILRATGSGLADTTRALGRVVPARAPVAPRPAKPPRPPKEPRGSRKRDPTVVAPAPEPVSDEDVPEFDPTGDGAMRPPEPPDAEYVITSTHVEAPSLDGATRYPDIFGGPLPEFAEEPEADPEPTGHGEPVPIPGLEPEPEPEEATKPQRTYRKPTAADLTPQGRMRGSLTDDPDFHWQLPSVGLLGARPPSRRDPTPPARRRPRRR